MERFIPRAKLSKKAKRALDAARRQSWALNPVTRQGKNAKVYDRKKHRKPDDGDGAFLRYEIGAGS